MKICLAEADPEYRDDGIGDPADSNDDEDTKPNIGSRSLDDIGEPTLTQNKRKPEGLCAKPKRVHVAVCAKRGADIFKRHGGQGGSFESCTIVYEGSLLAGRMNSLRKKVSSGGGGNIFRGFAWYVDTTLQTKRKMIFTGLLHPSLMESEARGHAAVFRGMRPRGKRAVGRWIQLHNNRSPLFLTCFMVFQARWLGKSQMLDILGWSKTVSGHAQAWYGDATDKCLRKCF